MVALGPVDALVLRVVMAVEGGVSKGTAGGNSIDIGSGVGVEGSGGGRRVEGAVWQRKGVA